MNNYILQQTDRFKPDNFIVFREKVKEAGNTMRNRYNGKTAYFQYYE